LTFVVVRRYGGDRNPKIIQRRESQESLHRVTVFSKDTRNAEPQPRKEEGTMALYLDEAWIKDPNPERIKEFVQLIGTAAKNPAAVGAPPAVRFVAGPWASNEEAKVIFVVDIPDHTPTFQVFSRMVARGLVEKRRLTPIVEWSEVEKAVGQL
jgi:hypothetical protein